MRTSTSLAQVMATAAVVHEAVADTRRWWVSVMLSLARYPADLIEQSKDSRAEWDAVRTIATTLLEENPALLPRELGRWVVSVAFNRAATKRPGKDSHDRQRDWLRNLFITVAVNRVRVRYRVSPTGNIERQNALTWTACEVVGLALKLKPKTVENVVMALCPPKVMSRG